MYLFQQSSEGILDPSHHRSISNDSSLGLLRPQECDFSFGSIEGIAGLGENEGDSQTGENIKEDLAKTEEISQMRTAMKKLSEEKSSLQQNLSRSEDAYAQLAGENESLKVQLRDKQASLDLANRIQYELEDLKVKANESFLQSLHKFINLSSRHRRRSAKRGILI